MKTNQKHTCEQIVTLVMSRQISDVLEEICTNLVYNKNTCSFWVAWGPIGLQLYIITAHPTNIFLLVLVDVTGNILEMRHLMVDGEGGGALMWRRGGPLVVLKAHAMWRRGPIELGGGGGGGV